MVTIIFTAIVSASITAALTDWLARCREKRARLRAFVAIMIQVVAESEAVWPGMGFAKQYSYKVPNMRHEQQLIARDIPKGKRARFNELMDAACRYAEADISTPENQKHVTNSIRAVADYVDSA